MELVSEFPNDKDIQRVRYDAKKSASNPCRKMQVAIVDCVAKAKKRESQSHEQWKANDVEWMKYISSNCADPISAFRDCSFQESAKELDTLRRRVEQR